MNTELIRKLALQQIQEEEQRKKEEEIQLAVALEVERLRSRPATELVKDDLTELKNELFNLKQKVRSLEEKLSNNPLERKVMELATYMGDTTLAFRSTHGINKRRFRNTYEVLNNNSNNNWYSVIVIAGLAYSFSIDYSKRIFQIGCQQTNNPNGQIFEYTFHECCIDPYTYSKNEFILEVSTDKVTVRIGDVLIHRDLPRKYSTEELFDIGFITMGYKGKAFVEYY